jgi:glucokinase
VTTGPGPAGGDGAVTGPTTLGVDVGGTKILGLVVDGSGAVRAEAKAPTPRFLGPAGIGGPGGDAVIDTIADVVEQLLAMAGPGVVSSVGVGVPGLVDDAGMLRFAPNLPGVRASTSTAGCRSG